MLTTILRINFYTAVVYLYKATLRKSNRSDTIAYQIKYNFAYLHAFLKKCLFQID